MCTLTKAVSENFNKKSEELYQAYLEASQDCDRENELKDWDIQACAEPWIEMPSL